VYVCGVPASGAMRLAGSPISAFNAGIVDSASVPQPYRTSHPTGGGGRLRVRRRRPGRGAQEVGGVARPELPVGVVPEHEEDAPCGGRRVEQTGGRGGEGQAGDHGLKTSE